MKKIKTANTVYEIMAPFGMLRFIYSLLASMKHFAKVILLALLFVSIPKFLWSQNNEYHILLNTSNSNGYKVYDTLATLDFLSLRKESGQMNIQEFEGFNYPKLGLAKDDKLTLLSNDSIEIKLTINPFDSVKFKKSLSQNKALLSSSLYFRESPQSFDFPPFLPTNEITKIEITVSNKSWTLSEDELFDLYNPTLDCWTVWGKEICGLNGYVTENGEIIMTLICGEGAAASKVIFLFNSDGSLNRKLSLPVI